MKDSQDIAISVKDVKKTFRLPHQKISSVKGLFVSAFRGRTSYEAQQVLRGVSFEVKRGEFFGIVGRNGGGKSTLLKLLAGIYVPNEGTVTINGKLAPFIELGVGFNPELTGRENVYLNGALLGFSTEEVDEIYDQIVDFAELEEFMDQKLSNYSSGMQVRLAFSVAIQAKADILLIDEVLAVGDANFQKKCFDTFETFKKEGRTVVFVSHSMEMVARFCDRVILLDKGKIKLQGKPDQVTAEYEVLNLVKKKDQSKIQARTPRETHILEAVTQYFKPNDKLVEIRSDDGRHVALLNAVGYDVVGVESDIKYAQKAKKEHNIKVYPDLDRVPDEVTGVLILDNKRGVNNKSLVTLFDTIATAYPTVKKLYVHMPFSVYQQYRQSTDESLMAHLDEPLSLSFYEQELEKRDFFMIRSKLYGTDQTYQYQEALFERIDPNTRTQLWHS